MNCPRCRTACPNGASFCPNCGNDLRAFLNHPAANAPSVKEQLKQASKAAPTGYFQGAAQTEKKKSPLGWIVAGVLAIALLLLGLLAMNLLRKEGAQPGPVLIKQGKEPGPVMQQTGKTEPVLEQVGKAPTQMPDDIRKWLEHLERIEKKRGELSRKGLSSLMVLAQSAQFGTDMQGLQGLASGDPDAAMPNSSADKVADQGTDQRKDWADLKRDFASYPPPAECQTIAESYSHALDETGAMILDVLDAVELAKTDTTKALSNLYGMKNQSGEIDKYGTETDDKVKAICDKYDTRKWFSISSDFGNSSILGSLGAR